MKVFVVYLAIPSNEKSPLYDIQCFHDKSTAEGYAENINKHYENIKAEVLTRTVRSQKKPRLRGVTT
jgi:hypothetical protein